VRWATVALALLLLLVQAELWFGRSGLPYVMLLDRELAGQRDRNESARERNAQVQAELADLKEGLEMVEEKARAELGMIKPNEILVQVAPRR
jgi:cell division protein FtsB